MDSFITLNNGVQMPRIGFGVYQMPSSITKKCVMEALSLGYRHIDTAQIYGNESQVGEAVRASGIPRNEIFITTKLWGCRGYQDTLKSIESSLKRLNIEYIDLLLIHQPAGDYVEIYRAMEDFYHKGQIKALGISNFYGDRYLKLVKNCKVKPQINQVETHVFRQQHELRELMKEYETQLESWSPLACGKNDFFHNSVLSRIAEKHGKSVAQVGLRFLYQQNIVIIPKSTHKERMAENKDILDFELSPEEMEEIRGLDKGKSLFGWW